MRASTVWLPRAWCSGTSTCVPVGMAATAHASPALTSALGREGQARNRYMDGLQMYQRALQLLDLSSWAASGSPRRRLTTFHTNVLVVLVLLDYISSAWVGNHLCWALSVHDSQF